MYNESGYTGPRISGKSAKMLGVSEAFASGMSDDSVRILGRWKSISIAQHYRVIDPRKKLVLSRFMAENLCSNSGSLSFHPKMYSREDSLIGPGTNQSLSTGTARLRLVSSADISTPVIPSRISGFPRSMAKCQKSGSISGIGMQSKSCQTRPRSESRSKILGSGQKDGKQARIQVSTLIPTHQVLNTVSPASFLPPGSLMTPLRAISHLPLSNQVKEFCGEGASLVGVYPALPKTQFPEYFLPGESDLCLEEKQEFCVFVDLG